MQDKPSVNIASGGYQPSLQSLRGLAALLVVLHHCTFYYDYDPGLKRAAEVLLNAHGAVILFFVLSGYVLAKTLLSRPLDLAQVTEFYVRRVFRIYPALWFSVAVVVLYVLLFLDQPMPGSTSTWWWPDARRTVPDGMGHYFMVLGGIHTPWALPLWTLKVEIIGSILMPFVVWFVLRAPRLLLAGTAFAFAVLTLGPEISGTALYLCCFLLGTVTLWLLPALDRLVRADWQWILIGLAGLVLLLFSRNLFVADYRLHYFARSPVPLEALGAAMLIAMLSVRPHLARVLERRPLTWLGDVSYSLYLLHMPLIGFVAAMLDEVLAVSPIGGSYVTQTVILTAAVLLVTLPLADLSFRYVEKPGIALGKRMHIRARSAVGSWRIGRTQGVV